MKQITKLSTMFLSALLMLLGFGGCKSAKKAVKDDGQTVGDTVRISDRPVQVRPDPPGRIRVLYGPPPAQYRINKDAAK